jgi:hypothetical protein
VSPENKGYGGHLTNNVSLFWKGKKEEMAKEFIQKKNFSFKNIVPD